MSLPTNATTPPKIGEYAYYDSRIAKNFDKNEFLDTSIQHWIVQTNKSKLRVACHYSLPTKQTNQPFITCHDKIISVVKAIY